MRKFISVILLLIVFCLKLNAQIVKFSTELSAFQKDENIPIIANIWDSYLKTETDSVRQQYWGHHRDLIAYIGPNSRMYDSGMQYVFNISKITDTLYEINTISYGFFNPDNVYDFITNIYKVCAVKNKEGDWQLISYLDANMDRYIKYETPYVEYIFPKDYELVLKTVEEVNDFIAEFCFHYPVTISEKIRYVVSHSLDESSRMVGLFYTLWRSANPYAGRTLFPNTILTTRINHIHEVVHALLLPEFPNCPYILQEGIATYYGGYSNVFYPQLYDIVRKWAQNHPCDFTDQESLKALYIDDTYPVINILGAMIVEYTIRMSGYNAVMDLFQTTAYHQIFNTMNIDCKDINRFVYTELLDLPYIQK